MCALHRRFPLLVRSAMKRCVVDLFLPFEARASFTFRENRTSDGTETLNKVVSLENSIADLEEKLAMKDVNRVSAARNFFAEICGFTKLEGRDCAFRNIRPAIPLTSGRSFQSIRPLLGRGC